MHGRKDSLAAVLQQVPISLLQSRQDWIYTVRTLTNRQYRIVLLAPVFSTLPLRVP